MTQAQGTSLGKRGLPDKAAADVAVAAIKAAELQVCCKHVMRSPCPC